MNRMYESISLFGLIHAYSKSPFHLRFSSHRDTPWNNVLYRAIYQHNVTEIILNKKRRTQKTFMRTISFIRKADYFGSTANKSNPEMP